MTNDSQRAGISTGKVLVLLVIGLISLTFLTDWLITSSENKDFRSRYQEIEIGMQESIVVSILGSPNERSAEFYLGQREGFEEVYERAAQSSAAQYLIWRKNTDMVYAVGLNKEGNVAFFAAGGT